MKAIEAAVTIRCPVESVFAFYRDFENLPRFLGDVMAVEPTGLATYRWTIQGPLGIRMRMMVQVTEERTDELVRYQMGTAPGLRAYWEVHFARGPNAGETDVRSRMTIPFGRLGQWALALIGKFPAHEASSNLHRLKEVLETGKVTDMSYSVPDKWVVQR